MVQKDDPNLWEDLQSAPASIAPCYLITMYLRRPGFLMED
jgi:hypothetical protein